MGGLKLVLGGWAGLVVTALLAPAQVQNAALAQTLRMGVGAPVTSIDPQYHNISPNNAFASMVFGALVDTDGTSRLRPGLALSWKPIADDLWEFRLRPDATFHNGRGFGADDVAFTFERIPTVLNSPGSYATYIYAIDRVEIIDPLTLRLHTRAPDPLLPANLSQVWMLNRATHAGAATDAFNAGRAAVGTGPFRVRSVRFGDRMELDRNDTYWGAASPWEHVSYRQITNEAARSAAVLSGDVDFIDQVPTADVARMRTEPNIRLSEADSLRVIYVAMDQMRGGPSPFITDNDGKALERNPLKDLRVRRALSLAIDRETEVARVMEGIATPTLQYMARGTFGYVPDLQPGRARPEEARRLLAEAGYPQGFTVTLDCPNDRYIADEAICTATSAMLARIGIKAEVFARTKVKFFTDTGYPNYSTSFYMLGWTPSTYDAHNVIKAILASRGRITGVGMTNTAGYANARVDALEPMIGQELDRAKRQAMIDEVAKIVQDEVGFIPLHQQGITWAARDNVELTQPADNSFPMRWVRVK